MPPIRHDTARTRFKPPAPLLAPPQRSSSWYCGYPLQDHLKQLAAGAVCSLRLLLQHTVHRTGQCKTVQAGFGIGFFLLLLIGKQNTMQVLMFLHGVPEMPEIPLW